MNPIKICKDCKFCNFSEERDKYYEYALCDHENAKIHSTNLITGSASPVTQRSCCKMRNSSCDNICGKEGKWYEQKTKASQQ